MKVKEKFKNLAGQLADGAGTFFMWTFYFVVGLVMAVPYTFLAGWDVNNLFLTAWALPIASVIIYTLYTMCKMKIHTIPWWIHRVFYGLLGYCLLPIFANGISIVLKWVGLATTGGFIFEYRYASLVVVPVAVIIGLVTYSLAKSFWHQRFSGNATPPSSTPPSGFGPNKIVTTSSNEERKPDTGTFQLVSA
ncbi:MAG: hypothetical protein HYS74_00195 [Parcubacteria group bacterium]|nr:hypothetical protein [Parcubacteria group bacterium]